VRTYSCDRCGLKFAESGPDDPPPNPKDNSISNGMTTKLPVVVGEKADQVELREFDLCPACIVDLNEWRESRSKKSSNGV
jgi:hypothetical protein